MRHPEADSRQLRAPRQQLLDEEDTLQKAQDKVNAAKLALTDTQSRLENAPGARTSQKPPKQPTPLPGLSSHSADKQHETPAQPAVIEELRDCLCQSNRYPAPPQADPHHRATTTASTTPWTSNRRTRRPNSPTSNASWHKATRAGRHSSEHPSTKGRRRW